MAKNSAEIYVARDGEGLYRLLDLDKSEAVQIAYKFKDAKDPSKIFLPYSLMFDVDASSKNNLSFGFYGNEDIPRTYASLTLECKIYIRGNLAKRGILKISNIKYEGMKVIAYSCRFTTKMVSLKEKLGETLLTELDIPTEDFSPTPLNVLWDPRSVFGYLNRSAPALNDSIRVPLASMERVWTYSETSGVGILDNIWYDTTTTPAANTNSMIKTNELRPAIRFLDIYNRIVARFGLSLQLPSQAKQEMRDLWVWCTNEKFDSKTSNLKVTSTFSGNFKIPCSGAGNPTPTLLADSKYKILRQSDGNGVRLTYNPSGNANYRDKARLEVIIRSVNSSPTTSDEPLEATITFVNRANNMVLSVQTVGTTQNIDYFSCSNVAGNNFKATLQLTPGMFEGTPPLLPYLEVDTYVSTSKPTTWMLTEFDLISLLRGTRGDRLICSTSSSDNYLATGANMRNIYEALPPMKAYDFLSSMFTMFNMTLLETQDSTLYGNGELEALTPAEIEASKREMDYTNYWDGQSTNKVPIIEDYNSFNFKHATSKYRSNVDYTKAAGNFNKIEYGQEKYTVPGTKDVKEYKTETKFSVIPGVQLPGTKLITYYGFNSDAPDFTTANEARYKPNFGELTLFYEWDPYSINGNPIQTEDYSIACQSTNTVGQPTVEKMYNVTQFMPFTTNGKSLLFNALQSTIYDVIGKPTGYPDYNNLTQSLYSRYYSDQTARFLDPNVYISSVKMDLDLEELYLTDGTVSDPRPYGFRLQNDIILDNQRYKIEEANIDYTTGKSTFKISNYNNIVP